MLRIIFKLFIALIHNTSPNINENIIDIANFSEGYKYLFNLGLLQLIIELSKDEKYILYNSKYLITLVRVKISKEYIKVIKDHFFDYNIFLTNNIVYVQLDNENKVRFSFKDFKKTLKYYSFLLKLMKNLITKISDEKNLEMLLEKFIQIIDIFDLFKSNLSFRRTSIINSKSKFISTDNFALENEKNIGELKNLKTVKTQIDYINNKDINCKIIFYRMTFIYYLIKLGYRLIKKSQQIKLYASNVINLKDLIKIIFELKSPFSEEQISFLVESNQYRDSKLFLKLKYYFKTKYIGCCLNLSLLKTLTENRNNILKNTEKFYTKLNKDLDYSFFICNKIDRSSKFEKKYANYELVYENFRKEMYKYFFKGIFPLIYYYLCKFKEKLFKNNEDYTNTKLKYLKINRKWSQLYSQFTREKNSKVFYNISNYISHKKSEYLNIFKKNIPSTEPKEGKDETRT